MSKKIINNQKIYLDYAATTPLSNNVKECVAGLLDEYGNPSSTYSMGKRVRKMVSESRHIIANFINTEDDNIFFTGSGSASNTIGVSGYYRANSPTVLFSPTCHKSILKCASKIKKSHSLAVDKNGKIDMNDLKDWLAMSGKNILVVFEYANSEIGTIQDVKRIIDLVHFYNGKVYVDCTGSISTIPLDVARLDIDMCGFSAHKIGGLKGCGVFYKKPDIRVEPLVYGSQEGGICAGTENIIGIVAMGKAIESYHYDRIDSRCRDYVYSYITDQVPDCYLVGTLQDRLPHNLYICLRNIDGAALVSMMDLYGIQISTGSACNNSGLEPSQVLTAIGMDKNDLHSCIRMTFGGHETIEQLNYVCRTLHKCVDMLRREYAN